MHILLHKAFHWLLTILLFLALAADGNPRVANAQTDCEDLAEIVSVDREPADDPLPPRSELTITWVVENTGSCTWTASYRVTIVRSDGVDSARSYQLRRSVKPGRSYEVSVDIETPAMAGAFTPSWRLESAAGSYFGPPLELAFNVAGDDVTARSDVELPRILAYGGFGGVYYGDDCVIEGPEPEEPWAQLVFAEPSSTSVALCGFPAQTDVEVHLFGPQGEEYSRSFAVGEERELLGVDGSTATGTAVSFALGWRPETSIGAWRLEASGSDHATHLDFDVDPTAQTDDTPRLTNWPVTPADPFDGLTCVANYAPLAYAPAGAIDIYGSGFGSRTAVMVGVYAERYDQFYLVDGRVAPTDSAGAFVERVAVPTEPQSYFLFAAEELDPTAFENQGGDASVYMLGFGDGEASASSCFRVADSNVQPLLLAFMEGWGEGLSIVIEDPTGFSDAYPFVTTDDLSQCEYGPPAWDPDGERLVFSATCMGSTDLYTWDAGNGAQRLTDTPDTVETDPDFGPGGLVVFRIGNAGESAGSGAGADAEVAGELAIHEPETGQTRTLGVSGHTPRWSPDGSQVAYASAESGSWQIYIVDADGGEPRRVSRGCATHCQHPAWSPDGDIILYSKSRSLSDMTSAGIWSVSAAGGRARAWLEGPYDEPAWSDTGWVYLEGPDGLYRMQDARREATPEVYLYAGPDRTLLKPAPSH